LKWEFTPRDVVRLLTPSILAARNRRRFARRSDLLRAALFGGVTIVFSVGIFAGFYRVLVYVGRFAEFTAPLTHQMLATVSVFLFTVLLASNIITAYSTQYVSEDLSLLASGPIPLPALYGSRLILTLFQSSWMVLVFSVPVYLAFALTSSSPIRFLVAVALVLPPLLAIPAALGSMVTGALVSVFPARRVREALMMIGALFVVLIVFLVRTQQPERLLNPRSIYDVGEFFSAFRTPASPLLPSTWATDLLAAARHANSPPWFLLALLYSTAAAAVVLGCWQARALYWRGFSRAQEALPARFTALPMVDRFLEVMTRPFELRFRSLLLKDLKTFLRDTTQWSQLFLLLALVVVYLYNFSVLPSNFTFATFYLQNLFSFLNLGLAGFVLSAVAVRFVFTSVSIEGRAFWIIRSSPLSLNEFLWSKFWTALPPLLVLSQILTLVSNHFLGASRFMTVLASVSILFVCFGIVGMGVGMGAMFPRFRFENVTQIAGSSGGLLYMIATSSFIAIVLFLEALPVYFYLSAEYRGASLERPLLVTIAALVVVAALNVAAVILPIRWGQKRLAELEL
jgi:ABC-2 type transport system permease protein